MKFQSLICLLLSATLIVAASSKFSTSPKMDSERKHDLAVQLKMSHFNMSENDCLQKCTLTRSWPSPNNFIGLQDGKSFDNKLCPFRDGWFSVLSLARCINIGVMYPGKTTGCPNDCFEEIGYGTCVNSTEDGPSCSCSTDRGGADCSQVSSSNQCSGQGTLIKKGDLIYCVCRNGFGGEDCSVTTGGIPIITPLKAQYDPSDQYGENHPLFVPLTQVYFTMSAGDFLVMRSMGFAWSDQVLPASMVIVNGKIQQKMTSNVGLKIRGGVTRLNVRKSYTIDMTIADQTQNIAGIHKFGLRSLPFDPSYIRDKSIHDLQYYMGVKRTRSAFSQVYVNGIFMGLYLLQEQFDEDFLKSRFGETDGTFIKGETMAYLDFKGTDRQHYADCKDTYGVNCYDPKTPRAETFTDLVSLITTLNLDVNDRKSKLPQWLDMDDLFRNLAIEMAIGQTDGLENGKNYYLYKPKNKPFQLIMHDFDMTFGFKSYNLTSRHTIWNYDRDLKRPLYSNTLSVKEWRDVMKAVWTAFLTQFDIDTATVWNTRLMDWQQTISKAARMDKWHAVDFGWSFHEFTEASMHGGFSRYGVPQTSPCEARNCLWVEGVADHVFQQRAQILEHLNDY